MRLLFTNLRITRAGRAERVDAARGATDDAFGRGLDMALTIVVFAGLGWLVDRWLGLFPLFTIVLLALGAVGLFAKVKYAYDAQMDELESERRVAATSRRSSAATPSPGDTRAVSSMEDAG